MFETFSVSNTQIVGVRVSGMLTDEDYKRFLPVLEELIAKNGPISICLDMEDFQGWSPKAAWEDLKFGLTHDIDIRRVALIGAPEWVKWMFHLFAVFFTSEIRFFPPEEKNRAIAWLESADRPDANTNAKKKTEQRPYAHILLATDFSPHAEQAALRAREIAGRYQARLSIIHVFDDFVLYDEFFEPVAEERLLLQQTLQDSAREQLTRLAEKIGVSQANASLLTGPPKPTILSFAKEHDIDLIVLGSHGRRGIERLLGSVASGIVNSATCDVLTVRLEEAA